MISQVTPSNLMVTGLTDKPTWRVAFEFPAGKPENYHLGANCFSLDSAGWFVPSSFADPDCRPIEMIESP